MKKIKLWVLLSGTLKREIHAEMKTVRLETYWPSHQIGPLIVTIKSFILSTDISSTYVYTEKIKYFDGFFF